MRAASKALVGALLLTGCLNGPTNPLSDKDVGAILAFDPDWDEVALPQGDGHNHHDGVQHQNRSTPNFKLLGWNPLESVHYGHSRGGYLCGDAAGNAEKRYGVVHGLGTDIAFILVDVTDPAKPTVLGELAMPYAPARDVAITPDLRYIVIGSSAPRQPDKPVPTAADALYAEWRSPCNDGPVKVPLVGDAAAAQYHPFAAGAILVNIDNPKQPTIESYVPLPVLGAHSIYANKIGSQYYVLASVVNAVAAVTYFHLFDIVSTPAGGKLVSLSIIREDPTQGNAPVLNGHNDGVIMVHPGTKKTYAYLAHWHQGLLIVDLTNPRVPQIVGRWSDNPPGNTDLARTDHGDIHEALPLDTLWEGKHYTFVGQEIVGHPTSRPSGYLKALDTTDPTKPKEAAHWNLPAEVEWKAGLQFSTHYITRVNRTIFMSHYHAGVWAIDASDLGNTTKLPAIGAYLPSNVPPNPRPSSGAAPSYSWTPTIMDTNALPNGDLVVWDMRSGVYMLRFDGTQPAPAKEPYTT